MHLIGLDLWLWLAGLVEHGVLLIVLFAYRRAALFPVFTTEIAANVVRTVGLFFAYRYEGGGTAAYYYTYLPFAALDIALQIGVAYEIALHVFRPAGRWSPGVKKSFIWFLSAALALSCALSWLALPATRYLADTLLIRGNFLSAVLMSELFVGMLILSVQRGLPWNTYVARIAQGFGTYSLICIVVEFLHTYFGLKSGTHAFRVVSRSRIAFYQATVVYWVVSLMRESPAEQEMPQDLQIQLVALQRRAGSLIHLLQSWRRA